MLAKRHRSNDQNTTELTFRTDNQTSSLLRPAVDSLDNVNQLLLILQHPIQLIIVARAKIAHHVFVSEEEHERHRVVEFVHLLEVGHLIEIAYVENCKVFDSVGDSFSEEEMGRGVSLEDLCVL